MEIINFSLSVTAKPDKSADNRKSFWGNFKLRSASRDVSITAAVQNTKNGLLNIKGWMVRLLRKASRITGYLWLVCGVMGGIFLGVAAVKVYNHHNFFAYREDLDFVGQYNEDGINFAMRNMALGISDVLLDEDGNIIMPEYDDELSFKEQVEWTNYTVKPGDTVSGITYRNGLSNISTLIQVNDISNVRSLMVGEKLKIPSVDGIMYKIQKGDTLNSIASKYSISMADLLDINDLSSENLVPGDKIFIPGAKMDSDSLQRAMGETWICPLSAKFTYTSYFGPRKDPITGEKSSHKGVDMACPKGTAIKAAMSGTVIAAGYHRVFGNYVIVKHIDNYQSLYGHMSKISVKNGQRVNQGQQLGLVGSTGYSTGNHLHFQVFKNQKLVDPLTLIKR